MFCEVWSRRQWIQNVCSNLCAGSSVLIITEIQSYFAAACTYLNLVVLVCSAKYRPTFSRSHKMAAFLSGKKSHIFPLFSKSVLVIPTKRRSTFSRNITLGNGGHLKVKKIGNFAILSTNNPQNGVKLFVMVSGEFFLYFNVICSF